MNDMHRPARRPAAILGLAAVFAALALAAPVAADQRVDVLGRVVGFDGRPLAGSDVRIVSSSDSRSATSNRSGSFVVLGLNAAASATMTIEKPGYLSARCALPLLAGHFPQIRVTLLGAYKGIAYRTTVRRSDPCVQTDLNTNDDYDIN